MSEKRKNSNSPLSTKSRFKLKTKRTANSEENETSNGETTPKRCSNHSTPVRKSNISNHMEDSPEMYYRCSPIMGIPLSQKNEVTWSWHSPNKEKLTKSDVRTPKRKAELQRKRMPDSMLMFAASKVKIKEKGPHFNKAEFIANFQQFNQPIPDEHEPIPSTSYKSPEIINEKINSNEKNFEQSDEISLNLVYPSNAELDESLVRCSQLCEDEFFATINEEQKIGKSTPLMKVVDNKGSHIHNSPISNLENLIKVPIETPRKSFSSSSSTLLSSQIVTPTGKLISIADDSFDDYLSQMNDEDFVKIENNFKKKNSRLNSTAPKKSLFTVKEPTKLISVKSCSTLETKTQANEKLLPKTKSFDLQTKIYPINETMKIKEKINNNEKKIIESPRKFFKSKCNSEPLSKTTNLTINNPSYHHDSNNGKIIGKSIKCKMYSDSSFNQITNADNNGKLNQLSQNRVINNQNNVYNNNNNNNRNFENIPLSINRPMDGFQVQQKKGTQEMACSSYTKEEIEKKRIEAKMKLLAKQRMLSSKIQHSRPTSTTTRTTTTTTTTTTRILPIASSVKR